MPVPDLESTSNPQSSVDSSTLLQRNNSSSSNVQASEDPSATSATEPLVLSLRLRKTSLLKKPSLKGLHRSASVKSQKGVVNTSSSSNPKERVASSASRVPVETTVTENENETLESTEGQDTETEEEEEEGVYIHRSNTSQFSAV